MKKFLILLTAISAAVTIFSGCISSGPDYPPLCNVMWVPESGPAEAALQLNPYGRAAGFTGNNRFFAPATFDADGNLRFGAMALTRAAGPHGEFERRMMQALSETRYWKREGRRLTLFDQRGKELMSFRATAEVAK